MSLVNQLIAAVFAVLIGLVAGTLFIMSDSSKNMLLTQLESHGQDTATHLGLYLAPYVADKDTATIEATVNAIFDSGFYQKIVIRSADNETLFETSTLPQSGKSVPDWFVSLVQLTPPSMSREISFQWRKVGSVLVQSRADYAYSQLWQGAQNTLILFVSLSLLSVLLLSTLIRYILSPLRGVEEQAQALAERQYIEQENIPKTRELKRVVLAMNSMVKRVQKMFAEQSLHIEELRKTAYQDNLTGLANQRSTMALLSDWLDNRQEFGPGCCIYLHVNDLQALNSALGEEEANNYLKHIGGTLSKLAMRFDPNIVGRLTGSDFAAILPTVDEELIKRELNALAAQLTTQSNFISPQDDGMPFHIAVTTFDTLASANLVMSDAKLAIQVAKKQSTALLLPDTFTGSTVASESWQQHVAKAIQNKNIFIQFQPVFSSHSTQDNPTILQRELLARILNKAGEPCSAGEFIHVVKSLNLISALDRAILEKAVIHLAEYPEGGPLTVNLSQQTIHEDGFSTWITQLLKQYAPDNRLNIEINETAALNDIEHIVWFRNLLRPTGVQFGVDNFGVHPSGFSYLYSVQPNYIKIDGSLSREVDTSAEDRFLISSLITAAHSLDIQVYAERVERNEQVQQLNLLKIDGTQGFLYGQPEALN